MQLILEVVQTFAMEKGGSRSSAPFYFWSIQVVCKVLLHWELGTVKELELFQTVGKLQITNSLNCKPSAKKGPPDIPLIPPYNPPDYPLIPHWQTLVLPRPSPTSIMQGDPRGRDRRGGLGQDGAPLLPCAYRQTYV
eukprot:1158293-Pelagomonas_calceolata.AAC.13